MKRKEQIYKEMIEEMEDSLPEKKVTIQIKALVLACVEQIEKLYRELEGH